MRARVLWMDKNPAMGRGQNIEPTEAPDLGWTKQELMDSGDISAKTFDLLRKAARVKGPSHGGLTHIYSVDDVVALILKGEGGTFSERAGAAATAWRALLESERIYMEPRVPKRPAKMRNR